MTLDAFFEILKDIPLIEITYGRVRTRDAVPGQFTPLSHHPRRACPICAVANKTLGTTYTLNALEAGTELGMTAEDIAAVAGAADGKPYADAYPEVRRRLMALVQQEVVA